MTKKLVLIKLLLDEPEDSFGIEFNYKGFEKKPGVMDCLKIKGALDFVNKEIEKEMGVREITQED